MAWLSDPNALVGLLTLSVLEVVLNIDNIIFITILAGTGSVVAPFAGALIYGAIRTMAYDLSPNTWQMSLGTVLLILIVFLPDGLWSLVRLRHARHP